MIGIAQAISLNTGITLISDVIGLRGSSGAFVFGMYSFLDKITSGVALFVCTENERFKENDAGYIRFTQIKNFRWATVLVPTISCVFAWLLVVLPLSAEER